MHVVACTYSIYTMFFLLFSTMLAILAMVQHWTEVKLPSSELLLLTFSACGQTKREGHGCDDERMQRSVSEDTLVLY